MAKRLQPPESLEVSLLEQGFSNFEPWENDVIVVISPGQLKHYKSPTLEHTYQAYKTHDADRKRQILLAKTPGQAKRLGGDKTKTKLISGWDKGRKVSVMKMLITQKFAEGSDWAIKLLATGTARLIEYNRHHDTFWGRCICDTHNGQGQNMYGVLLTERRNELSGKQRRGV